MGLGGVTRPGRDAASPGVPEISFEQGLRFIQPLDNEWFSRLGVGERMKWANRIFQQARWFV